MLRSAVSGLQVGLFSSKSTRFEFSQILHELAVDSLGGLVEKVVNAPPPPAPP